MRYKRRMGARLAHDPFATVLEAFNAAYPGRDVVASFVSEAACDGAFGFTNYPDDGSPPTVHVGIHTPIEGAVEVLAHELAHVVAGIEADHGPEWEAAFDAIHEEFSRRAKDKRS